MVNVVTAQRAIALGLGTAIWAILCSGPAAAHVSEKAIVLLLPTDVFSLVGTAVVALTFLALALFPPKLLAHERSPQPAAPKARLQGVTSVLASLILLSLIALGLWGPRDPLANLLVLVIWTGLWIVVPVIQGLAFDLWAYINPWRGILHLLGRAKTGQRLPDWVIWLTLPQFAAAALFALVYIAPADPAILARVVLCYWLAHLSLALVFGQAWLERGEALTVFLGVLAKRPATTPRALGVLAIVALATGSFDSLNETFWWLAKWGINPLEFPGRSGVFWQNTIGYLLTLPLLATVFLACLWGGFALVGRAGQTVLTWRAFAPFALTLLPIFMGYHIAHFLTSAYVNLQYLALALNDPLARGANLLGLGETYVTTGIFNTIATVRVIWLLQGTAIVIGHMIAIFQAHRLAYNLLGNPQRAALSQIPMAAFMVGYTLFGLWLLASPTAG